jgi:PAS domain S-box-containing protein
VDRINLNNIFNNIPGSVFWKDRNSVYLGCNTFQAKLANLASPKDIVGKTDYDLPWYESADTLQANDKRVIESNTLEEFIEVVKLPDGRELVMFSRKSPLYDEEYNIIGIIGGALDITALKKSEALKDSAREKFARIYLNNILKKVPGSVFWKDRDGVFLGCNDFQAKMAGFSSPSEMIGKTNYDLPWDESADTLKETDERIMKTGISEELIEVVKLADGTEPTMLSRKSPLFDEDGNIIGIIGTSLDITELKEAERQKELAQKKSAIAQEKARIEEETRQAVMILAGSVAHDLRTPLATIGLMSKYIRKYIPTLIDSYELAQKVNLPGTNKTNDFQPEKLLAIPDNLEKKVNEMNTYINDTLKALSRAVMGSLTPEDLVPCASDLCIKNAVDAYPFDKGERDLLQLNIRYRFTFLGNPVLFMRVIFNLLQNSLYQIKKNSQGKIFISSEEGEDFDTIRVKDTAGGASDEIINDIFHGYKTTKKKGTGIGLAFCKLTMKSFGGDIICRSIEGDCIEFTLQFPKLKP